MANGKIKVSNKAPKKNDTAKKAAPAKKGAIKTGRVTKTAKKNTRKAAKDTATTAASADTADAAATPKASSSTAKAPKERFSAKNPPPGFIGEEFKIPYAGYVKGWIAGRSISGSPTPIALRAVITEKELVKKPDNTVDKAREGRVGVEGEASARSATPSTQNKQN
ncbi:hypothetical protein ACRALDRAFT_1069320 [Sodiomyces alcalophilus JCM 7366]|uniref:uncharacterized protein n=1 Tax=Sodiomyces alcalophilus JCM 7366 TaxID=591952 RepID=UPI0039B664DA